ncbi:YwbE family protein [Candidatus Magnetomoraceae bacterium gMMP-13]
MNGTKRKQIHPGLQVSIVLKKDQRSGKLTKGIVKNILTKSPVHRHGIKVRLESGEIGRVNDIIQEHNTA